MLFCYLNQACHIKLSPAGDLGGKLTYMVLEVRILVIDYAVPIAQLLELRKIPGLFEHFMHLLNHLLGMRSWVLVLYPDHFLVILI